MLLIHHPSPASTVYFVKMLLLTPQLCSIFGLNVVQRHLDILQKADHKLFPELRSMACRKKVTCLAKADGEMMCEQGR